MKKKEYLQLPPIEYGEDSNIVKIIWEYLHLDDDAQKAARAELDLFKSGGPDSKKGNEAIIRNISAEDLQGYHEAIRETIRECIQQASVISVSSVSTASSVISSVFLFQVSTHLSYS